MIDPVVEVADPADLGVKRVDCGDRALRTSFCQSYSRLACNLILACAWPGGGEITTVWCPRSRSVAVAYAKSRSPVMMTMAAAEGHSIAKTSMSTVYNMSEGIRRLRAYIPIIILSATSFFPLCGQCTRVTPEDCNSESIAGAFELPHTSEISMYALNVIIGP